MTNEKKPLVIFSTDWHLKPENIPAITDLVKQKCELAKRLGVNQLICLGDIFDSRISQREEVLTAFERILDIIGSHELKMTIIPGNHDKTIYSSVDSFLAPYRHHPAIWLIDRMGGIPFIEHGLHINFLPFFEESTWINKFKELCEYIGEDIVNGKRILCTHIAVTGSRNNDGSLVSSTLSSSMFKDFYKVFSGHYHDQQKIGSNFYHIPSIQQNNFGENPDKGFTVLYSDGSHDLVDSNFRQYLKVVIDLDEKSIAELDTFKKFYANRDANVRFEVTGSENVLKSLHKEDFTILGIDLKTKSKEIEGDIKYAAEAEVKEHTASTIKEEFAIFCEENKLDLETGLKYLNQILK